MKKILLISSLLSYTAVMLHAQKTPVNSKQVQTTKQLQPMTQQTTNTTSQNRSTVSQQPNKLKIFPITEKIHFLAYKKTLTKPGITKTLLQNRTTYTNTNFNTKKEMNNNIGVNNGNSNSKNVMDNTVKKNNNSTASTRLNDKALRIPMTYTVSRNLSDGHKTSYTLTDNTDTWSNDFAFTKNIKGTQTNNSDPAWNCVYTTQTFNAQSTSFMNASVNQKGTSLIPGTIYSFDDYSKGNFREYTNGRNPIVVWTPTTVGNNSTTIQNPSGQTISQGISNIVSQFSPTQSGASGNIQTIYSDNQSDLNILVSAGGSYSGFSGFGITKQDQSQHHIYITYDAIKPLYQIKVDRPANGYFADGKTPVTSSPLVLIQNVTYGTRLLANIDIQTTSKSNYDSLHLKYEDGADQGTLDFSLLAKDKTLSFTGNVYVVGTTINIPIVSLQNFQQQISNLFAQGNFRTALPIQYQLSDLDGNTLGVESITDQFTAPDCHPADEIFYLQSVYATITTGNDGKNNDSQFWVYIYNQNQNPSGQEMRGRYSGTGNEYLGRYYDDKTEFNNKTGPVTLLLDPPQNSRFTLDDFKNGGVVQLSLKANNHIRDDWDIGDLRLTFKFMSNKGTPYQPQPMDRSYFRFSTDGPTKLYFDGGFHLIQ